MTVVHIAINDGKPIENDLIRGSVLGKKVDEGGFGIGGALFGLFRPEETTFTEETALLTAESNEIGVFGFFNVPYGDWIVRELKPAPAFVLNETLYPVTISEQEETIEIVAENRYITGNIHVLKKDADTGEPLSGVVIGLFDAEGNEVARGVTESGELLFEGIRYGRYELRELEARDGYYLLEEPVPVEISEHGQTVTVELTNQKIPEIPQTGDSSGTAAGICLVISGIAGIFLALTGRRRYSKN